MVTQMSREDKIKRGAEDSGAYFRYMADYVGFTQDDADAIHESGLVIEKYIPEIVAQFYTHLLNYPPTRSHFLRPDGTVNQDYLHLRMSHLANFWRKTAYGKYDDDYARYVDYVGRAHTSQGADPNIYIAERYVIGQVGFMQHAISNALSKELHEIDPELEMRSQRAWNLLMMVILEMLSRAYSNERDMDFKETSANINPDVVLKLAVDAYESGLGMERLVGNQRVQVAPVDQIPEGERKLVNVDGISIGVFHHKGGWYALRNSCLHRGGPVCTGRLEGDVITCPWHGYQYNVTSGALLVDPSAKLKTYPVDIVDGAVYIEVPVINREAVEFPVFNEVKPEIQEPRKLQENEYYTKEIEPGQSKLLHLNGVRVAVYNVDGKFYATQEECTHEGGPLSQGDLRGDTVVCPWHGSCFRVTTGEVLCGPARNPLQTLKVSIDGEIGKVE